MLMHWKRLVLDPKSFQKITYPVEDHVDPGNGDGRVDNDALTSLMVGTNNHLATLVLIGNQRSDVGLDTSSSETDDDDRSDETTETSAAFESSRNGCAGEDEETDDVDTAENDNSVVLSEVLISNDSTKNGRNIAPELEESRETSGSLVAHAERTTSLTAIKRALDVVLEDTGGTVVGEALAKFDDGDQEGRLGQRLADLAEGQELVRSGFYATKSIIDFDVVDRGSRASRHGLLDEVLLGDAGSSDIVVGQRQAVQVWVVVSLSLLVLQLVGAVRVNVELEAKSLATTYSVSCAVAMAAVQVYDTTSDQVDQWKNRVKLESPGHLSCKRAATLFHLTLLPSSSPPASHQPTAP